eukprot:CAMPEP_0115255768 /NCGR_PEP_ID=MMETSP0270-20121206/45894_1 /TAXON_ID=71861 /ORGANISM="Scrippsiella trochoidea, Strain CCMP3099" /LENGTH=335 /DNA_ID=CAMNT_0002671387 /DNA_START=1 /DNA_END=1004 /DNA_ORIENTATION=-
MDDVRRNFDDLALGETIGSDLLSSSEVEAALCESTGSTHDTPTVSDLKAYTSEGVESKEAPRGSDKKEGLDSRRISMGRGSEAASDEPNSPVASPGHKHHIDEIALGESAPPAKSRSGGEVRGSVFKRMKSTTRVSDVGRIRMDYSGEEEVMDSVAAFNQDHVPQPSCKGESQDAEDDKAESATSTAGRAASRTASTRVPSVAGTDCALFSEFPEQEDPPRESNASRNTMNERLTNGDRATGTSSRPSFNRTSFTQLGGARPSFQNGRISFNGGRPSGGAGQDLNVKRVSFSQLRRDQYGEDDMFGPAQAAAGAFGSFGSWAAAGYLVPPPGSSG